MKTYSSKAGNERYREICCNLCGSKDFLPCITGKDYRFVRCLKCSLVYQHPQPVFDDLKKRYRLNYFDYEIENEENFFHLMCLGLKDIRFDRLTSHFPKHSRFLDIGCATGMLLQSMRSKGWCVQGVELCRESAEYAYKKRDLDVFVGTLEEAAFPSSCFSVIHFSHLIEHVPDPKAFLKEVYRVLKPDGFAVITTPNVDGFQARLFKEKWRSAIADHLTLFSKTTLSRLVEESNFSILDVKTWGGLAKNTYPLWIKKPADFLAKRFGFGDVVLLFISK